MIIDTHVHIFRDDLAEKAALKLQATANIPCYTDFTERGTRARLEEWGIDLGVVLPIATKPRQQRAINDWAAGVQGGNLVCFGTVHPHAEDAIAELDHIVELGLLGVKLHPDYQDFMLDDETYFPLYENIAARGLPLVVHTGFDPVSPDIVHAPPQSVRGVVRAVPSLKLIAAHMGGNFMYDDVERYIVGEDVYIDISMAPGYCPPAQFERIIKNHGAKRVLFASDCPWTEPARELEMLSAARLSPEEMELILYRNARGLLGRQRDGAKQALPQRGVPETI